MREWNLWLVPFESDTENGNNLYFPEKYYIMPDLLEFWGHDFGWGFKDIDKTNLIKGVDFDTAKLDTVRHVKIAHGAPTVKMKDEPCAVLTKKGIKDLTQKRRRLTIQRKRIVKEFNEQIESAEVISLGEHARIVRRALKNKFPDIKFRVLSRPSEYGGNVMVFHSAVQLIQTEGTIFHPREEEIKDFIKNFDGEREDPYNRYSYYNVGFLHEGKRLIGAQFIGYRGSDFDYLTDEQKTEIAKKVFEI